MAMLNNHRVYNQQSSLLGQIWDIDPAMLGYQTWQLGEFLDEFQKQIICPSKAGRSLSRLQ